MSETNNELLAALESADQIKVGDVVTGEVLAIDNDNQAVIGLHTGEEGVVPAREYSDDRNINLADELKVGDSVEAVVISNVTSDKEGVAYLLSKKRLEARKAWENLSFAEGDTVDAKVINAVRGGGHLSNAATQIADVTTDEVKEQLLDVLAEQKEE